MSSSNISNYKEVDLTLTRFIETHSIPNIIFHGNCSTQKEIIVNKFVQRIYDNNIDNIKQYVMYVNCAHGKGIKFVRDDLKYFAKTNIQRFHFKTVVFFNADKLTIDAQSALRRCIEIFSHSTRFFMVVDNISKLLNPILSRFCSIHIVQHNDKLCSYSSNDINKKVEAIFDKCKGNNHFDIAELAYKKGISVIHILEYMKTNNINNLTYHRKQFILFYINKIKKEIRHEKLLITTLLSMIYSDETTDDIWIVDYFI